MLRTQNAVRASLLRSSNGPGFFFERAMSAAASPPIKRHKLNPRDEARVRDLSQRVITALAQGDRRPHVKRSERDRRGMAEENRLREAVENPDPYPPPPPPITDTPEISVPSYGMEFSEHFSLPDIPKYVYSDAMMDIQPGYLLESQKSGHSTIGVVLGFEQRYRSLHILCISANGGVFSCRNTDVSFSYPSFVSSDIISRAGLGEVPTSYVETAARIQIVKRVRQIERAVQIAMLRIVKRGSALYGMFKDPDPHKWGIMTLVDALRATFGQKADLQLHHALAMKEYLLAQSTPFIIQTFDMLRSRTYFVRPLAALENLQQVADWIRNNDESIEKFVRMAKPIIEKSRRLRRETSSDAIVELVPLKEDTRFSPTDIVIIKFLQNSLLRQRYIQEDPYAPHLPSIIKRLEGYDDKIMARLTFRVLQDLGVYTPWDTMIAHGADGTEMNKRGLPLGPPGTSPMEILAESRSKKILELSVPVQVGDSHLTLIDGLDSIRHDFGQTPAFAIDDFDAKELDDAISIEPIPASHSYWVHVHVADPTSIIHPRDEIARIAEHRGVTAYFVERTWPMLPPSMTEALFSLGSTSLKTLAQPVLTFSYEVDEQGHIVQSKIRPALVRNVISLRYDDVDRFLNDGAETKFLAYPLTSGSPFSVPPSPIPEIAHEDMRHLAVIAQRLGKRRSSSERVLQWVSPQLKIFLHSTNLPINPLEPSRPSLYRGFPKAELGVEHIWESPARGWVSELMIAAGIVASRFAKEHKIPFIYRASLPHTATEQDCAELMGLRNGAGTVPLTEVFKRHIVFGRSIYTTEDMPHETMGVFSPDLYCRVTSPLRRFVDLVNHWQIKSALRNTLSPNALSFPPTAAAPVPLFAKGMLDQLVVDHNHVDMAFKRASQSNLLAWAGNVVQNALANPTNEYAHHVLNNLDAVVMGTPVWANDIRASYLDVTLPQLGFPAAILDFDHNNAAQMGETLKARIHSVELGMTPRVILKLV